MQENKTTFDLVVVMPVGPSCNLKFIEDTIDSILYYMHCSYVIVLADDSQRGTGSLIRQQFPDVHVITTPVNYGKLCGLYLTLSQAYSYALEHFEFKALLRMDTDALIINHRPEKEALALFTKDPAIAMAGQYPNDYFEQPWDISWPAGRIRKVTRTWRMIKNPWANLALRELVLKARQHGYKDGESVFGGACFVHPVFLKALQNKGLLGMKRLRTVVLEEDHLFAILAKSLGFHFADLSSGDKPFACAWKGLPASPDTLWQQGKKIIHSTKFYFDSSEGDIRAYFKKQRK